MSSLSHHGIKGQKWGVRRFQNKDGTRTAAGKKREADRGFVIKKGSIVKRTTDNKIDYKTGRRKYVSINDEDAKKWRDFFAEDTWTEHYEHEYKAKKDLYIATGKDVVEIISNEFKSDADKAKLARDTMTVNLLVSDELFRKAPKGIDQAAYDASSLMRTYSSQYDTESGKRIAEAIMKSGFDGLIDSFGQDISEAPVIIFDAEKKLKKKGVKNINAIHTSIGGTMYIEGNALILGDSSYLEHHGILGQKWGVRRFQNKDGTRTAAGKARDQKNAAKSVVLSTRRTRNSWQYQNAFTKAQDKLTNDSKEAVRNMAVNALNGKRKAEYEAAVEEYDAAVNYRYDEYRKEELKYAAIAGMASGARYPMRYAGDNSQDDTLKWDAEFYMYDDGDQGKYNSYDYFLVAKGENPNNVCARAMNARNNIESIAEKDVDDILGDSKNQIIKGKVKDQTVGDELKYQITEMAISASDYTYVLEHGISYDDDEIKQMKADIKKYEKEVARLGLAHSALFIEDGTLYLSHHGIRGQRWGVRRFQNRDGSLTNAGRKRLGYATKGAAQTVGKAFKAGVKAGGNAVKAVKAHHEKKEAEKLQKKKEKASKTRLGVMANKDLFTNEEIRKLNERFKLEDEMKMATLQKGVEIAKAVGTIAQNVGTVAKTYEDVTGQSLSPIKRKAAEEKARQDKEDRERRIAREDAEEARKAAKEERDIAIHEQTLRKAIAAADTQEFTAQKTKAEADSSVLDAIKKGQDFNGGSDATGKSWMEKATAGGKNPFFEEKLKNDPELAAAKAAHDAKAEWKQHEQERDARIAAREKEAAAKQSQSQQKQGGGDDDALFSQKGSLPVDKDRYRNNRAMEKAKQVKEDAAEERAKKQDEKAVNRTIDDTIEANRSFKEVVRAQDPHAYDRGVAKDYIKGKLNNLPNALADLNPINRAAKKIADKATKEEEAQVRKSMKDQYDQMVKNEGRDEANYVMYNTRVANLQAQGYSERKAKQIADSNPTFSAKRNRKKEYYEKVGELESTHRKNAEELHKANKELTDYYYKLVNGPGYDPGTPKREALDRKYRQKRGELERLEKDNNDMLEKGTKEAKKILEHSFSIQNGVLFIDSSDYLAHHGIRGQRWGVRRFQNPDGTLTAAGKRREARQMARELNQLDSRQATASRNYSNLSRHKGYYDKKVGKLEYKKSISDEKGNLKKSEKLQKKIDKGKANVERISRMMKFASDDYDVSEKKIKTILSKINESTDYAWKTTAIEREFTSYNGGFYKDMKNNAGKSKLFEGNYYQSAYGNHYTVKHDKNGKRKKKWEASKQQRQTHNPVHTVH